MSRSTPSTPPDPPAWFGELDPASARALRAASVYGRVFWVVGLRALLRDLGLGALDTTLEALAARGLLTRLSGPRRDGEDPWAFTAPGVAESIAATLAPRARRIAHDRAAEWLQSAGELDAEVIAGHLLQGNAPAEAAPWCAEAARVALRAHDYERALEWSSHAVRLEASDEARGALRVMQAGIYDALGSIEEGERCAAEAWQLSPRGSTDWFRAAASTAVLGSRRLRPERFRELAPALEDTLRKPRVGVAAAGLANAMLPILQAGLYGLARLLLKRLEEILAADEHPEPTFPARVHAARAIYANFEGDAWRFLDESRAAAQVYEAHDEPRFALLHWNNVGFAQALIGDAESARETFTTVIAEAEALSLHRVAISARHNLGLALLLLGRVDEARNVEAAVITAAESLGDVQLAAVAKLYLARAFIAQGDFGVARSIAARALEALTHLPASRVLGLAIWADASRRGGDYIGAVRATDEGLALLEVVGSVDEGDALLRLARVESLRAIGDLPAAGDALRTAHTRLTSRAARCADEAARTRFLYDIPEHARIMQLVDEEQGW